MRSGRLVIFSRLPGRHLDTRTLSTSTSAGSIHFVNDNILHVSQWVIIQRWIRQRKRIKVKHSRQPYNALKRYVNTLHRAPGLTCTHTRSHVTHACPGVACLRYRNARVVRAETRRASTRKIILVRLQTVVANGRAGRAADARCRRRFSVAAAAAVLRRRRRRLLFTPRRAY